MTLPPSPQLPVFIPWCAKRSMAAVMFDAVNPSRLVPCAKTGGQPTRIKPRVFMFAIRRISARSATPFVLALLSALTLGAGGSVGAESHALAMHGSPAIPSDFTHLPWFNPDAPQGGRLVWGNLGTFDSLNPIIVRGIPVQQVRSFNFERGYVVESLMARGENEPFTLYGLIAKTVETDDLRSWVVFHIDERAHFSDGHPITVVGSFNDAP